MTGRYTLTVTYSEPNPLYVAPPQNYGGYERDTRTPEQQIELNTSVLSCELTPEQFNVLKYETLKVWQMQLVAPLVMNRESEK
jgi:hypothetical protein